MKHTCLVSAVLVAAGASLIHTQGQTPPDHPAVAVRGQTYTPRSILARNMGTEEDQTTAFTPHKIVGNVYYVGTRTLSSFLVVTPQGHVLIDSTYERNVPVIQKSVEQLGFTFADIRILLGNHAHGDHQEGDALVKQLTGAQVVAMAEDVPALELMKPGGKAHPIDRVVHDGDSVTLGGTTLVAHLTPGHTRGCTTWTMKAQEGGRAYDVMFGCSLRPPGVLTPAMVDEFNRSFKLVRALPCDVQLGDHGAQYNMQEKFAKVRAGGSNPFIEPASCTLEAEIEEAMFHAILEEQQKASAPPLLAQSSPPYRVTHTYTLGGDGGWDYIVPDPPNHRLFIGRQNRVMVVDEDNGTLLGEVTGIQGAHGTALAAATGHGFATSGNDQSVVMFDLKTFKVLGRIPAAEDADAIIYDSASNRVFTFNGDAHSSTVIDPRAGTLITNIPLGGKPEYGASAGDGKVYANLTDTSEVVEIDAKAATVTRRWPTAPCQQPVAMAIDIGHHRLFSGCRSGLMAVSDYQAGKVVATLPIGAGVDGAGFDAMSGDAFASNADGTLTVIHQDAPDQYRVVQTVKTPLAARNMGLDPSNHRIFIVSAQFGPVPEGARGRGRGPVLPGTFTLMVIER